MTARPLVSILIPCYNAAHFVRQCIESALAQSCGNTEVIVFDDGSSDSSRSIIEEFGSRIRFEFTPLNGGANAARNRLTQLASGEWLQYLDADDYLLPEKIARDLAVVKECPHADIVYSAVTILEDRTGGTRDTRIEHADDHAANYFNWNAFATHAMLLRRSVVLEVGGWKENQPCCQEHELLCRCLMASRQFKCMPQPFGALYRMHDGPSISHANIERVVRHRMNLSTTLATWLESTGSMTEVRRSALARARFETARYVYRADPQLSKQLMAMALDSGCVFSTPAAPLSYRIVQRMVGFELAEQFAGLLRR